MGDTVLLRVLKYSIGVGDCQERPYRGLQPPSEGGYREIRIIAED